METFNVCVCVCSQADFSQGGMEGGDGGQVNVTETEHDLTPTHHSNNIQHKYDANIIFSSL